MHVFYEWEYQLGIETVKNFSTEISSNNISIHQLSLPNNMRNASFVTQMSSSMATLTITAVGYCGKKRTSSIPINIQFSGK